MFYETAHFLWLVKYDIVKNTILRPFYIQTEGLMMEKNPAAETSLIHFLMPQTVKNI
jgi:hypothetical protein